MSNPRAMVVYADARKGTSQFDRLVHAGRKCTVPIFRMHRPQIEQWCVRSGFEASHLRHHPSLPSAPSESVRAGLGVRSVSVTDSLSFAASRSVSSLGTCGNASCEFLEPASPLSLRTAPGSRTTHTISEQQAQNARAYMVRILRANTTG